LLAVASAAAQVNNGPNMIAIDRLDSDSLSALRSLSSGFPSLQRALESAQRFSSLSIQPEELERLSDITKGRLAALEALATEFETLLRVGVPAQTKLYDIPFVMYCIRQADQRIREGHGFQGFA
jgi:hypothetical protein